MGYTLLIIFFIVSIVFSFLCSVWEAVLMSISPSYPQILIKEGNPIGHDVEEFKKDIEEPIAAILTLNTIAHTVGAIGVGAQATAIWGDTNPLITGAVVPVVMTLAILILSEIIPKTLGAKYWKGLTPFTVKSVKFLLVILAPVIWMSNLITSFLKGDEEGNKTSKTEIAVVTEKGEVDGAIEATESRIIKNLLRFDSLQSKDIMTPRTVVHAAQESTTVAEFYNKNPKLRFSRIPIFSDSKDNISGFFMKDDLLTAMINKEDNNTLKSIRREIAVVNEQMSITDLFNQLMEKRDHIAMVVDEFGGLSGIVTMEDVIETILGMEIMDEFDKTADMQSLARKNWEKRAKQLGIIEGVSDENA